MAHAAPDVGRRQAKRVALVSLVAAVGLAAVKAVAGLASGSIALLSEAAHSGLDAIATLLTYLAVRIAARPPDEEHPYGHGKAENLSALVETMALLVLALFLANEAIQRLIHGGEEAEITPYVFAAIVLSIIVDGTRARALRNAGRKLRSPALEADALNFTADLMTSSIVLVGLVAVRLGFAAADAMGGLVVAGFVAVSTIRMGRNSIDALMDRAPRGEMHRIRQAVAGVEGVAEVRRVRLRETGNQLQTDVVVAISRTLALETAHDLTEEIEKAIHVVSPDADVVIHVEPLADEKVLAEKVIAVAARYPQVQQVHNVFVALQPDGFNISLHAKFPESMPVVEAHAIADELEHDISGEIEGVSRVDTHLEPLEDPAAVGLDVTHRHEDLVRWVTQLAEQQSEVENCHEVVVMDTDQGLAIVLHCDAAPVASVGQVHGAATRIEGEVHRQRPQVERVTVHFEPAARDHPRQPRNDVLDALRRAADGPETSD